MYYVSNSGTIYRLDTEDLDVAVTTYPTLHDAMEVAIKILTEMD